MRRMIELLFVCAAAFTQLAAQTPPAAAPAGPPPGGDAIVWILGKSGRLSAYNGSDFRLRMTIPAPLPPDARAHPESISVSRSGLVLYAKLVPFTEQPSLWVLWSNGHARELVGRSRRTRPAKGGGSFVTRVTPIPTLGVDGKRIFWFEDRLTALQRENMGEISQTGEFLSWTTDLSGRNRKPLVRLALPRCRCATGACEETCPEIDAWFPAPGVSDFFFLTRVVPGQLGSYFLETDLYRENAGTWVARKLPGPVYSFLDAADHGRVYLAAIPDAGCCGWENESDDQSFLVRGGKRILFFDERARFHNPDYDVSFFTSNARLSPDASQVAYTVAATFRPGQTIRVSDRGKANPEELRSIQTALARMPQVEVETLSNPSKPRFRLPDAQLIGWWSAQRLLVWQQGRLLVVDAATGHVADTGLHAEKAADVFLLRPEP